jgi:hypothetical protein
MDKCQANGCREAIQVGAFMCSTHWSTVPSALKRTVRRSFRERGGEQRNCRYLPYLDACAQAVEFVAMHEMVTMDNAFRRAVTLLEEYMVHAK